MLRTRDAQSQLVPIIRTSLHLCVFRARIHYLEPSSVSTHVSLVAEPCSGPGGTVHLVPWFAATSVSATFEADTGRKRAETMLRND